ncbi:hypothetical protein [Candidatus Venteria ishoeyi]|nr:hypothetical protein [Candidatus Venteria ishoeyi]
MSVNSLLLSAIIHTLKIGVILQARAGIAGSGDATTENGNILLTLQR